MKKKSSLRRSNRHVGSHIALGVWCLVVFFPLWVLLIGSFKGKTEIYTNPFGPPGGWAEFGFLQEGAWRFSNYVDVFKGGSFLHYFKNSFLVVIVSLALVLLLGSLASYALANWITKFSRVLFFFFMAGMMLPIKIASIRLLELIKAMGLLDSPWGLVPIYVAMGLPISVFILTDFIRQIPHELTEAALMDGAGRMRVLWQVILPLLRPALATVGIYNLVPFWNDLWFPLIFITSEKSKTLLLGVTRLFGQYQTDWPKVLAVLTLSALPVVILYLLMSKQFIKGLTAGAVKG